MSESVNFIQGRKEQYNPSEMQGGLFFSKDSKEILLDGESYGNATPADEEDITAEDGNLKLKDRAYDEASFSGKGYVILRKNLVLQEDGTYKNILTQDMINQANTIYEIRYDFDLNSQEINLAQWDKGASLNFTGGSIKNGSLRLNGNTQILGFPKFDSIIFSGQSLQYKPSIFGRKFNLLWFKRNNVGNSTIDFNDAWSNFLYSLGDWKQVNHNYIEIIVPSSSVYQITEGFYIPQWVSVDFCGSTLEVLDNSSASLDYVIKVNVNPDSYEQSQIEWVLPYPRPTGYLKNLKLQGNISKGILALDNRSYENIIVKTSITDSDKFIIFDQYPEAGGANIYLDQTRIHRLSGVMPNDTNDNPQFGWVKLGTGDAGIFTQIVSCRLFIFNRQGFSLNGGIQCYPYIVYSIGKLQNIHNEFPCSINIIDSKITFDSCIFYRKEDINNTNVINIYEDNTQPPFNVFANKPEVVSGQIPELNLINCIFAYRYRFDINNYQYYDILLDASMNGQVIPVSIYNSYCVSYGYGSQNTIHYKLRTHVNDGHGLLNIQYLVPQSDMRFSNLVPIQLNPDTRQLEDFDGASLQTGQEYTYYTVFSYGNRNRLFRSAGIKYTPTANWALFTLKYVGCSYNTYLIRQQGNSYQIVTLALIPSQIDQYGQSYTMDYGSYLNNRQEWQEYSEEQFNQLEEVPTSNNISGWVYNYAQDSFKYLSPYSLDSQRQSILSVSRVMKLDNNDIVICDNENQSRIFRFSNGEIVESIPSWATIE